jgi:ABC-type multidrug transport system fused ATPase/permease subunit
MFAVIGRSFAYLTPRERTVYVVLVTLRSLTAFLDVAGILLIGLIAGSSAGQLTGSASTATILGYPIPRFEGIGLLWLVVTALGLFVAKALFAIIITRRTAHFIAGIETRNAVSIADFVLRSGLDNAKSMSTAQLQYAVTISSASLFTGVLNSVATFASEGFLLLVIVISLFVVDPLAALATIVFFGAVFFVVQGVIGGTIKRAGQDAAAGMVDTTNSVRDSIETFREISVLAKQDAFLARLREARGRVARAAATFSFLGGMPRWVIETALIAGVVVFVAAQFLIGGAENGVVAVGVFLTGGVRIMASLLPLQAAVTNITRYIEEGRSAGDLLDERKASAGAGDALRAEDGRVEGTGPFAAALHGVTYRYPGEETAAVDDVTLEVPAGKFVAIIGPSGAGKTTIVDLLLGLARPSSGTVTIGGVNPGALRLNAPGAVAYVPQSPGMVTGSIADNIALGEPREKVDRAQLEEAARAAYLTDFLATLPDGIDTSLGAQVDALSGGQIQRIGLARALYTRPRLIILDEATSALDASTEAFISSSLRDLHGEVTVVVIAHRLSTVQHADMVHLVQEGRVRASGTFAQLRKSDPVVAEYVKLMSFEESAPAE